MNLSITCRHVAITSAIKNHVRGKLLAALQKFPQVIRARVVLDVQKFRHSVDVSVWAKGRIHIEAKDISDDLYKSVDLVVDKLARQLRRSRAKQVKYKGNQRRLKLADIEPALPQTE